MASVRSLANMQFSDNFTSCNTGYKLRDKIGKALKARTKAIRHALEAYNMAVVELNPSHESLTWTQLMDMTTLANFDLLHDSHQDIHQLLWTQPSRREAMNLYFGIKRTREEIDQLNVEIQCLITFMIDDHHDYFHAIAANIFVDSSLACELSWQWEFRCRIHSQIASCLLQTSQLKGFTGTLLPGI
jgi:hypothetical protein